MNDFNSELKKIEDIIKELQKSVVQATRSSNALPNTDFAFYQSYSGFRKVMDLESKSILQSIQSFVKLENIKNRNINKLSDEDKFEVIVELNDLILDRVNNLLDDFEGIKKKDEDLVTATLNNFVVYKKPTDVLTESLVKLIPKPQVNFKDKIDNFKIFCPNLDFKHNSIKPFSLTEEFDEKGEICYSHPYEVELNSFVYPEKYFSKVKLVKPKPLEETFFKFIDKKQDLDELVELLRNVEEIAVDLEYHSYRSFLGFTCLIQISTRESDFIIDAIALRNEINILNEVFTDPKILKVFHGADCDIKWLQKDFGIYVVNMFDTGQAARLLNFASFSLSFLFKYYCKETLNKKYQLADWRRRPLPDAMLKYAQMDTHNLLYIFDCIKNDLIEKSTINEMMLKLAFHHSKEVCSLRFKVPILNENSFMSVLKKSKINFNNRQIFALREIYSWRDNLARLEDESLHYVLPDHMMLKIAEVLPKEQQGILACCNPIPALVKKNLNELHLIVLKSRDLHLNLTNHNILLKKSIISCVTDITASLDFVDDEHLNETLESGFLLDSQNHNKIKIKRQKKDENSLGDFLLPKPTTYKNLISEELNKTFYEKYKEAIRLKKEEKRLLELNEENDIKIKEEELPTIASKIIDKEEEINQKKQIKAESEYNKQLESCSLLELNKRKKIKNLKPDITCSIVNQIDVFIENAKNANFGQEKLDKNIHFEKINYDIFNKNEIKKNHFDPNEMFMKNKHKNKRFNSRTKRKKNLTISSAMVQKN